jgi:hypothetical protein
VYIPEPRPLRDDLLLFAGDMVAKNFKGRRFKLETAALPVSAATVKQTAEVFGASFESTARHLVEGSLNPACSPYCAGQCWQLGQT